MVNALICVMVLAVLAVALLTRAVGAPETSPAVSGRLRLMECEGHCRGLTRHETDGDGTATCAACGTPRSSIPDGA